MTSEPERSWKALVGSEGSPTMTPDEMRAAIGPHNQHPSLRVMHALIDHVERLGAAPESPETGPESPRIDAGIVERLRGLEAALDAAHEARVESELAWAEDARKRDAEIERLEAELRYRETLQRQIDKVDEVLGWKGKGLGRIESIELLQAEIERLRAAILEADEIERLRAALGRIIESGAYPEAAIAQEALESA